MKTIIFVLSMLILSGCSTQHYFMRNGYRATVDNHWRVVVFRDHTDAWGRDYYRPQFETDCHPEYAYEDRPSTGGCWIAATRLTDIEPFYEP